MPLYLSIVLRARECAVTPYSSVVFSLGLTFESLKELGVSQEVSNKMESTTICHEGSSSWTRQIYGIQTYNL
jgi:hypothetical protein